MSLRKLDFSALEQCTGCTDPQIALDDEEQKLYFVGGPSQFCVGEVQNNSYLRFIVNSCKDHSEIDLANEAVKALLQGDEAEYLDAIQKIFEKRAKLNLTC